MGLTLKHWCASCKRWAVSYPSVVSLLMGFMAGFSFTQTNPLLFILSFLIFIFQIRSSKSVLRALGIGFLYSLSFYISGFYVLFMLAQGYDASYSVSLLMINFIILFYCMFFFIAPSIILRGLSKFPDHLWFLILMPIMFVGGEWFKTFLFTGLPWFQASHLLVDWIDVEYSLFGELGVSFLFYSFIGVIYLLILKTNTLKASALLVGLFVTVVVLEHQVINKLVYTGTSNSSHLDVRLLNSQVAIEDKNSLSLSSARLQRFLNIGNLSPKPDLLLFPESSIEYPLKKYSYLIQNQFNKLNSKGVHIVAGGYYQDILGEYNVLYSGEPLKPVYMKQHLIPFGEYFPTMFSFLKEYFPSIDKGNLNTKKYYSGELKAANQTVAPIICYEILFSSEIRERAANTGILMLFTDLAFIKADWVKQYLFNIARIRAMELSKPLLHIANSSTTAIINKKGDILKQTVTSSVPYIDETVYLNYKPSIFAKEGYLFALLLPLFNLMIIGLFSLRSKLTMKSIKRPSYV